MHKAVKHDYGAGASHRRIDDVADHDVVVMWWWWWWHYGCDAANAILLLSLLTQAVSGGVSFALRYCR